MRTYSFRKKLVEKAKEIIKDVGFERVAVLGLTTVPRTVAFFIISAVGVKNVRIFSDRDEAMKWLKET